MSTVRSQLYLVKLEKIKSTQGEGKYTNDCKSNRLGQIPLKMNLAGWNRGRPHGGGDLWVGRGLDFHRLSWDGKRVF